MQVGHWNCVFGCGCECVRRWDGSGCRDGSWGVFWTCKWGTGTVCLDVGVGVCKGGTGLGVRFVIGDWGVFWICRWGDGTVCFACGCGCVHWWDGSRCTVYNRDKVYGFIIGGVLDMQVGHTLKMHTQLSHPRLLLYGVSVGLARTIYI